MEKHLKVNTAILDMLATKVDAVEAYDEIRINSAMCLTTQKTRHLLSQSKIHMNTASVVELDTDEDVKVMTINGGKKITANFAAPKEPTLLIVNGGLIIEDSDKKNLDQFKGVVVNGGLLHPMSFDTSNFYINGASIPYPDGAVLLLQGLELNNSFINSAVPGTTYFVQGIPADLSGFGGGSAEGITDAIRRTGLHAIEPLDLEALKGKNIRFYAGWITVLEENAEQIMQITDGYMGSTIIPSGYKLMEGGRLDMLAVRRFGKRIFVDGDLQIGPEDRDALAAVEQLYVTGKVCTADCAADAFFEKCSKYGKLTVYKGEWVDIHEAEDTIDRDLLEDMLDGATFNLSNSTVEISTDVPADLLADKIHEIYLNASELVISLDQQKAIRRKIRNNQGNVVIREYESTPETEKGPEKELEKKDVVETRINCAYYRL